jgi:hypothetical protein
MNWRARPRHSERSSHGPRSGMQKRNPWGGRARLFPKSIQLQCLKYPPVAHPRGDHSDRRSTCHVTSRLLVPFPENTVAHPDTAVYPCRSTHRQSAARHTSVSHSAWQRHSQGSSRGSAEMLRGGLPANPRSPTQRQAELLSLALPCVLARFSPHNSPDIFCRVLSRICAKGEKFSRSAPRVVHEQFVDTSKGLEYRPARPKIELACVVLRQVPQNTHRQ